MEEMAVGVKGKRACQSGGWGSGAALFGKIWWNGLVTFSHDKKWAAFSVCGELPTATFDQAAITKLG